MVNKNDDAVRKSLEKLLQDTLSISSHVNARLIAEIEFLQEVVKELAYHLGVSPEEYEQICNKVSRKLQNRISDVIAKYFDERNNK